jgi:hypothetical protein
VCMLDAATGACAGMLMHDPASRGKFLVLGQRLVQPRPCLPAFRLRRRCL